MFIKEDSSESFYSAYLINIRNSKRFMRNYD